MNEKLIGEVAPDVIAGWKDKHGRVFKYTVDGRVAYLRNVDRNTYSLAASKISSAGPAKFNDIVIDNIWLGGDDAIKKQDGYYFGLIDFVEELMAKRKGELGEL